MSLNWYPGHMAKARRALIDQMKRVDVVIELLDARLPLSSSNPDLAQLVEGRPRLVLLNKADLADPVITRQWLDAIRSDGTLAMAIEAYKRPRQIVGHIEELTKPKRERDLARGIKRTARAMVIGVPNVGKSTLINSMKGQAVVKTADKPGVTRTTQWIKIGPYLELMDTPGMLWPKLENQRQAHHLAFIGSIRDEAHDPFHLSIALLDELMQSHPEAVMSRFKVSDADKRGQELLEAVCKGRGFLLKGAEPDYERGAAVVLDEFRAGKLGRISLEKPGVTV